MMASGDVGWTVYVKTKDHSFHAGIYYRRDGGVSHQFLDKLGFRTMVYRTRAQAREASKNTFYPSTVKKVRVTFEVIGNG